MADEIPNEYTTDLTAPGQGAAGTVASPAKNTRVFDVSNSADAARAWAALNNAAQLQGPLGPGMPIMPTFDEIEPRWDQYLPGVNLNILPRAGWNLMSFQQLRNISVACKEIRLNIELIKRTMSGFDFDIVPVQDKKGFQAGELDKFFQKPDGVHDLRGMNELILEDLLVLDATVLWPRMEGGKVAAAEIISGDTIRINIDFRGRPAFPPAPAFFQVIWGMPRFWSTSDRIVYSMMHPRSYAPYGKSPIEDIVAAINIAIRRDLQRIGYFTEGNVPHSFVGLPSTWNVEQIKAYQAYVDALIQGTESRGSRFIFVPHEGSNIPVAPFTTNSMDEITLDEYLMKVACWAFGNSPAEFGLTGGKGLGGAGFMEGMQDIQFRTAIDPIIHYLQDLWTYFIQNWLGRPDARLVAVGIEPKSDQLQQAQIDQVKLSSGIYTAEYVQDRDGIDHRYRPSAQPVTPSEKTEDEQNDGARGAEANETMMRAAVKGLKVELNAWQDTADRFLAKGWTLKPNTSPAIPAGIRSAIDARLKQAKSRDDIKAIFDAVFADIKSPDGIRKVFGMASLRKAEEPVAMESRTEMIIAARKKSEARVVAEIMPSMTRQMKRLDMMVRHAANKADSPPQQSEADQEKWRTEFIAAILLALGLAVSDIGDVENEVWTTYGMPRLVFDASQVLADYQDRIGRKISQIADDTLVKVQQEIAESYARGETLEQLIQRIGKYFDENRAKLIAQQETGNVASQITLAVMGSYGWEDWRWDAEGLDPCTNELEVNGGLWAGCKQLDGTMFKRGQGMPPDESHPGCYCVPTPVVKVEVPA